MQHPDCHQRPSRARDSVDYSAQEEVDEMLKFSRQCLSRVWAEMSSPSHNHSWVSQSLFILSPPETKCFFLKAATTASLFYVQFCDKATMKCQDMKEFANPFPVQEVSKLFFHLQGRSLNGTCMSKVGRGDSEQRSTLQLAKNRRKRNHLQTA